ncbi:DUF6233 domain-containing protein [Streptomyces sp. NBC_00932]|uniref:DUF6233 domain-containing protein n=1 Tax=Streptomyces sp. NBC_00932 TaxID=2903690 RepID=UPI0038642096|nr:DUF6233 domain-containing protein [Streptomyces sp. NBC_00932]
MSDRSAEERLYALQCLEQVQLRDLERTRGWIAVMERKVQEEQYQRERAAQPAPEWVAQKGVGAGPPTIHTTRGEADACWDAEVDYARVRPISREQALRALGEEGAQACIQCRPDTMLGLL